MSNAAPRKLENGEASHSNEQCRDSVEESERVQVGRVDRQEQSREQAHFEDLSLSYAGNILALVVLESRSK